MFIDVLGAPSHSLILIFWDHARIKRATGIILSLFSTFSFFHFTLAPFFIKERKMILGFRLSLGPKIILCLVELVIFLELQFAFTLLLFNFLPGAFSGQINFFLAPTVTLMSVFGILNKGVHNFVDVLFLPLRPEICPLDFAELISEVCQIRNLIEQGRGNFRNIKTYSSHSFQVIWDLVFHVKIFLQEIGLRQPSWKKLIFWHILWILSFDLFFNLVHFANFLNLGDNLLVLLLFIVIGQNLKRLILLVFSLFASLRV